MIVLVVVIGDPSFIQVTTDTGRDIAWHVREITAPKVYIVVLLTAVTAVNGISVKSRLISYKFKHS